MEKTTKNPITMSRFTALVEAYGTSPGHWPADEREAAQAFLAKNAQARALVDEVAWLDQLLDAVPHVQPSEAFKQGLLPRRLPRSGGTWLSRLFTQLWPESSASWPAAVLAGSLALGILIGIATPAIDLSSQELNADDVMSYAFSALDANEWL